MRYNFFMTKRMLLASLTSVAVIGILIGYYFSNSYVSGICYADMSTNTFDVSCHQFYNRLSQILLFGMPALGIVFGALAVFPSTFRAWSKFAIWGFPAAVLIFATTEDPRGGWITIGPTAEQVFTWVGSVYVIISLGIIAWVKFLKK